MTPSRGLRGQVAADLWNYRQLEIGYAVEIHKIVLALSRGVGRIEIILLADDFGVGFPAV